MTKVLAKILTIRNSLFLITIMLLLSVASVFKITEAKTHYSLKQFQSKEHPRTQATQKMSENYLLSEVAPFIVTLTLKDGSWLDETNLEILTNFSLKFSEEETISQVTSLGLIQTPIINNDSFKMGGISELVDRSHILEDPLLTPSLISKNGIHTTLIITPESKTSTDQKKIYKMILSELDKLSADITHNIGGPSSVSTQMSELLTKEIILFAVFSLVLALLFMIIIFKGITAPIVSLSLTFIANAISAASLVLMGIPFSVLSNTVPILITITVIAICSHSLCKVQDLRLTGGSKTDSIVNMLKELYKPHLLTAITTAIGFATLIPSKVPIIHQFGLSVAISVLVACTVCLITLPAILTLLPAVNTRSQSTAEAPYKVIFKRKKLLIPLISIVCVLSLFATPFLNWSYHLLDDLPSDHPARTANEFIDKNLGGTLNLNISIDGKTKDTWKKA